jgi:hypothetical protein
METFDANPVFSVQGAEYHRLLGWPKDHAPAERARELIAWARDWYGRHGRPWTYLRQVGLAADDDSLRLDGVEFRSAQLHAHLRGHEAQGAMLVVASAGPEAEEEAARLWLAGKPDEYFFLEMYASAVVEDLVARLSGRICDLASSRGLMAVPHYSPGYSGWDVVEQNKLFHLIVHGLSQPLPGPIEVLASGMLRPKKSLLGVFGLAPTGSGASAQATPCEACAFSPCAYRRSAYRHAATSVPTKATAPLPRAAQYSVNARALRKWAAERVRVEARDDGTIEATFRFDGTTCSNLGRPLAFDYRVRLGGADDGRRILAASCEPAAGDDGYQYTCAYLNDADRLLADLAAEKPLLGQPLDAVLDWVRPTAPSGCHCSSDSRAHKWGLALEAIHYALANAPAPQAVS